MSSSSFPTSSELALGVVGTSVALPLGYVAMKGAGHLMTRWEIPIEEAFTFFRFYEALEKISDAFFRTILKSASLVYIIVITPIMEEWVFRGLIYKWQLPEKGSDTWIHKTCRILSNGLIFGAFHINPLQGWVNIPIFAVSTLSGIVFAALREVTQNIWASTIAHSLNNTCVLFITFLKL